jgi:hypothetical protein
MIVVKLLIATVMNLTVPNVTPNMQQRPNIQVLDTYITGDTKFIDTMETFE